MSLVQDDAGPPGPAADDGAAASPSAPWQVLCCADGGAACLAPLAELQGSLIDGHPLECLFVADLVALAEAGGLPDAYPAALVLLVEVSASEPDRAARLGAALRETPALAAVRMVVIASADQALRLPDDHECEAILAAASLTPALLLAALCGAARMSRRLTRSAQLFGLSRRLLGACEVGSLAEAALASVETLLGTGLDGFVGVAPAAPDGNEMRIVAALGRHVRKLGLALSRGGDASLLRTMRHLDLAEEVSFEAGRLALRFGTAQRPAVLVVDYGELLDHDQVRALNALVPVLRDAFRNADRLERLESRAGSDPQTGLPTRSRLAELAGSGAPRESAIWVLEINDLADLSLALSPDLFDKLLLDLGRRLHKGIGRKVLVTRLSDARFGLCGPRDELARSTVERLFATPFCIDGHSIAVGARVGCAATDAGPEMEDGFRQAILALGQGNPLPGRPGVQWFDYHPGQLAALESRATILRDLRALVDFGRGMSLHYQPLVGANGQMHALEALLRWNAEDGESVAPRDFLPLAAQLGLVVPLGRRILGEALRQISLWQRQGQRQLGLVLNISVVQLQADDFSAMVRNELEFHDVEPCTLELDLDSAAATLAPESLARCLEPLRRIGVQFALDDAGAASASLRQLASLPVDAFKLDSAYVEAMSVSGVDRLAIRSLVQIGAMRGLRLIGKGVENAAQAGQLRELGCDCLQGKFVASPMSPRGVEAWMARQALSGGV